MHEPFPSFSPELLALPGRELARLSQTDVTENPSLGFQYAAAAYMKGLGAEAVTDPTLAGEAAAKAGFRAAQIDQTMPQLLVWFDRSQRALNEDGPRFERERLASFLLEGRAFALHSVRGVGTDTYLSAANIANLAFRGGETIATTTHIAGERWDPYATMLARHHATHEAVRPQGNGIKAASLATSGIWRALRARPETANQTESLSVSEKRAQHARFIGKQVALNTVALSLAVSKPLAGIKPIGRQRRQVAAKLIG